MAKNQKAIAYARERGVNDGAPYATKFATFIQAVAQAKATGCDMILIAEPWGIGDTFEEMTESLWHLAGSGVGLQIASSRKSHWNN